MIYGDYLRNKYHHASVEIADAEGVPCIMEYSKGKNLRNYEIYGNSVQDGTPSPDNPIEIQSVGDLTTKNLLPYPYSDTTKTINGVTFTDNGDGSITANGTATADTRFYCRSASDKITISPGTYTMSGCPDGGSSTTYYIGGFAYNAFSSGQTFSVTNTTSDWFYIMIKSGATADNLVFKPQLEEGSTATEYEPYHKYDVPITVTGKNLLPNSDWMSGAHSNGFTEQTNVDYITEYTQNSVSFNLTAWKGVSSPRFKKDSVKRIIFKINQNQINSDDGYINFYIIIQGYDDNNNKVGSQAIYNNAIADTEYVFDFSAISTSNFYKNSTQFSFCILARKNALSNLMVYDIAYYAETDTAVYEPYVKPTITHIYLNEPLRKVGDYADYIDFKNQKIVRNINYVTFTGNENWILERQTEDYLSCYYSLNKKQPGNTNILSNTFNVGAKATDINTIYGRTANNAVSICLSTEYATTRAEFKAFIGERYNTGIPIVCYYQLKAPTEESVSLPVLKTVKGTSVISVDTSIQPSNIKGKYIRT